MAKTVVETFRRLAQFSSPSSVYAKQSVLAGAYEVEVVFNQRDLEKKQDTKFIKNYLLKPDSASLIDVGRPLDISSELWRAQSQTGKNNDLEQPFGPTVNKPTLVCQSEVLLVSPSSGPPLKFTAILDMPTNVAKTTGEKFPLIVFPHGGPHSSFSQDYSIFVAGFLELGFAVLKVNYRGSTGQGQASIEVLPGNVGTYDVMDVKVSLDLALANFPVLDANRVVVFGGSHGGFLAAHLVGQFPSVFKAAVCRNPVINLTNMFGLTDIPDWTMVEGITNGMKSYHSGVLPSPDQFKEMFSRSPIYHVDKVKTPTMILVGMKDLRVPPSQGIQLYKALKARGVETDLKVFPEDCHPLSKVETEAEVFVLTINWFLKHLGITL